MTTDERLDRLVERHEALTRNMELLMLETEKHDRQIGDLTKLVGDIAQGIARLVHTAEMHEHRLDSHDDRLDNLEG
jgi:hypothetical protein